MAVLIDHTSRIIIQGMTGHTGRNLAARMLAEQSPLVAGVAPGRGGGEVEGLPVFDSCHEAVERRGANASFVCVPAARALEACLEAIDADIAVIVVYAEGVPVHDALIMAAHARARGATLLGPNAAGCISPGKANLSDLNAASLRPGRIGIVSKSGTLTYEVIDDMNRRGFGQSSVICLGGDPVIGTDHRRILELFEADPTTDAVVLIGEIGGRSELHAAEFVARMSKPVVAYIAGRHAPPGKRMGHAGALAGTDDENVSNKQARLRAAGAIVVESLTRIGAALPRRPDSQGETMGSSTTTLGSRTRRARDDE
jgi:succinyl-CoA synthetase alpha subunit